MNQATDLTALAEQPFDLLREMERRMRSVLAGPDSGDSSAEWVGIGFRIGNEKFVAAREQVREVLMLPEEMTRVPGAKNWLLGIANLRGHLLPLVDLKMMLGSGRTKLQRATRVISVNHRDVPAGLVVDEVIGFRRFTDNEFKTEWPQPSVRCDRFIEGAYQRGQENWPVFGLYDLIESPTFLQAAAE
jgi:twitching motility protein PilI